MEEHTMTDSTKKSNNLFDFATSELSQDAFFCWSLNWLAVKEDTDDLYYKYGKAMLDLVLGENKKDIYKEVKVLKQFNRIDVLVLFKDNQDNQYALIIEDKTNTSEHNEQIENYKNQLNDALSKDENIGYKNLPGNQIYTAYVKTGIMYTDDKYKNDGSTVIIDIKKLNGVISNFQDLCKNVILTDYYNYLNSEIARRENTEKSFNKNQIETCLLDSYGQLYFLNSIFGDPEQFSIGNTHTNSTNIEKVYINNIYTGTSRGSRWTQYCFWGHRFPNPILDSDVNEFHYLFWRVDCANHKISGRPSEKCIALKYYDKNIKNEKKLKIYSEPIQKKYRQVQSRNVKVYQELIKYATDKIQSKYEGLVFVPQENKQSQNDVKEKLLLLIPLVELQKFDLKQRKKIMNDIKTSLIDFCKENIEIMNL